MYSYASARICLLSFFFYPIYPGGGTRYPFMFGESLTRNGHQVIVVTTFPQNSNRKFITGYRHRFVYKERIGNIELIRVWTPPFQHSGLIRRLLLYLCFMFSSLIGIFFTGKIDAILGISPEPPFLLIPGFLYGKIKKAPYILTLGDLWPDSLIDLNIIKSQFFIKLIKIVSRISYIISDHIIVITSSIKKGLLKYGINNKKVSIIELCVDTTLFRPHSKNENLSNGIFRNKFIVMYSGIFGPAYDFDTLLNAAKLLEPFPEICFIIRGDGERRKEIMFKISRLTLRNVRVLDIVSEISSVIEYLNLADIFILPMKDVKVSETAHPSKVLEFLACGRPVVCSTKGELADLIHSSKSGLVVEPNNPQALAEAILDLYQNDEERMAMGRNGRNYVLLYFSYDIFGCKLKETLKKVTTQKRSRSKLCACA